MQKILLTSILLFAVNASANDANIKHTLSYSGPYSDLVSGIADSAEHMPFDECKDKARSIYNTENGIHPAKEMLSTDTFFTVKLWKHNSGTLIISCSKTDNKMLVTTFNY